MTLKFFTSDVFQKKKNLEWLAEAFMSAVHAGAQAHLVIVGDGPYLNELKNALAGYPVLFTGYLQGENLARIYASSDLFVFPSATDTFGNVVLEAQASGIPVIVTDQGGPQELMRHAQTGYIVPVADRAGLGEVLFRLVHDRPHLSVLGANARRFIEQNAVAENDAYSTIFNRQRTV